MKKYFLLCFLLATIHAFSQEFDQLLTERRPNCADIAYNSGLYFVKYMQENKLDTAALLLNYWEMKCGIYEPIFRAKILLALQTGTFNDSLLGNNPLRYMSNYKNRIKIIQDETPYHRYDGYKSFYGYVPPGQAFDTYTSQMAIKLKDDYDPESMEYLLAEFYGDDSEAVFSRIQLPQHRGSKLYENYNEQLQSYLTMSEWNLSFSAGVWVPTGNITQLGCHPEIGLQVGWKYKKMNYDLICAVKFINAYNDYYVRRKGSTEPELTNYFLGYTIGIDVGRDIFARNHHEVQLIAGIAYDGFQVIKEDKDAGIKSLSVNSYNFNIGLGYRYYVKEHWYWGIRAKINFVDYTLNRVLDFTGFPVTIHIVVGGLDNIFRNDGLRNLRYKIRP